ncbi:MAG: NfeD family protein [Pseudonocardiales bacterium]|nr:NfeD family protein [Pseudonocardiales bacterium]MBV9031859.1 NfeD family protein [Pseudonocardiales bacterium]MBW0009163.1 NfeD family protein [Pseudonocardiales bacterium]
MAAVLWLVAGFALIAAEVLSTRFVLIMMGMGALVAAGFAEVGAPPWLQVAAFAGTSLALTTLARPVIMRRLHTDHVPTNVEALVGDKAIVVTTVNAHGGKIKLRGELWSARTFDETEVLEPGRAVRVMTISGATAVVWGEP